MKKDETTSRLDNILSDVHSEKEAENFINEHSVPNAALSFNEFFDSYVAENDLDITSVIKRSRLSGNYVYNILSGRTKNPGRDKIIALCIAAGMSKKETDRALTCSGKSRLYPKSERDIRIIICINNRICDVTEVNMYLDDHGVEILNI